MYVHCFFIAVSEHFPYIFCSMKVKVLSFNLNLLPALSFMVLSSQGYENERLHEFIKYIDNYDIILLQEVRSMTIDYFIKIS